MSSLLPLPSSASLLPPFLPLVPSFHFSFSSSSASLALQYPGTRRKLKPKLSLLSCLLYFPSRFTRRDVLCCQVYDCTFVVSLLALFSLPLVSFFFLLIFGVSLFIQLPWFTYYLHIFSIYYHLHQATCLCSLSTYFNIHLYFFLLKPKPFKIDEMIISNNLNFVPLMKIMTTLAMKVVTKIMTRKLVLSTLSYSNYSTRSQQQQSEHTTIRTQLHSISKILIGLH